MLIRLAVLIVLSLSSVASIAAQGAPPEPADQRVDEVAPLAGRTPIRERGHRAESRLAARRTPVVEVFEANRDAVVNISSTEIITVRDPFGGMGGAAGLDSLFEDFFDMPGMNRPRFPGRDRQVTRTSVGSGFVIHPDGYIVTNAHVVAQTADRKVAFADGQEYDAEVIALDTGRDLAVLKIDARGPLPTIHLGRSNDLMIGETVIAIGNPLGFQNTVTAGVVSAIERNLNFPRGITLSNLIQTDASINPGNSGGPLLNVLGELIGVNTAIRGDAQNIGFAIPVDQLREVLPELLDIERRYRIICGLTVDTLNAPKVVAVQPDTPAERADIRVGDVLTHIDGRPVREGIDFPIALIGCQPEQTLMLEFERGGRRVTRELVLGGRPAPDGAALALEKLGLQVTALPAETAASMGFPGASGLLVTGVDANGPAAAAGVQRRDVLIGVGRHAVASVDDLGQLLEYVRSGAQVPVTVLRVDRRTKMRLSGELTAR